MTNRSTVAVLLLLVAAVLWAGIPPLAANADLLPGSLGDFEDGTAQGWVTPKVNSAAVPGGPGGSLFFLQVSPDPRLAVHNTSINSVIDPAVTDITMDLMRPQGQADLEMRLVLFGPGTANRWTSTVAELLPGDGVWRNYSFSILETDLTQVAGTGSYADLEAGLNRVQIRYDAGVPDAVGTLPAAGTFGMDNVFAVPEPGALASLFFGGLALGVVGRRRRP